MKKSNGKSGKYSRKPKISTTTILLVVLIATLLAALALFLVARNHSEPVETTAPTEESTMASEVVESTAAQTEMQTTEPSAEVAETEESVETEAAIEETEAEATESTAPAYNPKPTTPSVQKPTVSYLNLPYAIPGTTLVIQKVDSYDGIFLEDGSDSEVTGIYAMVLRNTGSVGVEYANITLTQNGRELTFKATALPAGGIMVVQEANATAYANSNFTDCVCDVALLENFEMSKGMVSVTDHEEGGLVVTNLTGETIPCIRIFYKFYMSDEKVYVGGITYTAKISGLAAGESTVVAPSHYLAGSSALVMVRTYETAD